MRLWSIKFEYLDSKGIVALWREALLAKKVLEGKTKGYKNHPQLIRFKEQPDPISAINTYLYYISLSAKEKGYSFDTGKINSSKIDTKLKIKVTNGQLDYELELLKQKLKKRSIAQYERIKSISNAEPNPLFEATDGPIEEWEKVKKLEE
jgi:hypothetical protein